MILVNHLSVQKFNLSEFKQKDEKQSYYLFHKNSSMKYHLIVMFTQRFQEYLRIRTVHPNPDYSGAVLFLNSIAKSHGFETEIFETAPAKWAILITWLGSEPALKSILLNSHSDVVPVVETAWSHPPFEAVNDNGRIYARGTQDMKSVTMQYLEALGLLKSYGWNPRRTIHMLVVPDEEIGGELGMKAMIATDRWSQLNVGFALDEGLASLDDTFKIYYGERAAWVLRVIGRGPGGHGSQFISGTAMEKLIKMINRLFVYRTKQEEVLNHSGCKLGDVCTLNLTYLKGGITTDYKTYATNVIPSEVEAGFDVRIPPTINIQAFRNQINLWASECGVEINILREQIANNLTQTKGNIWWNTFVRACGDLKMKISPEVFPAGTDSRFIRQIGIPALGFSPMIHTPVRLHDHDEFLHEDVFVRGISIYVKIIRELGMLPEQQDDAKNKKIKIEE